MSSDIEYQVDSEELNSESGAGFRAPRTSSPPQNPHRSQSGDDYDDADGDASESPGRYGLPLSEGEGHRSSPLKRPAEDDHFAQPPFKRQRGALSSEYLDLLNTDIEDAAQRFCTGDDYDLGPSQIGLTYWSSLEKRLFFEATGRLGRHNLDAIAARIGTKSVVEVSHYMNLLHQGLARRRETDHRPLLSTSDYPAAVELSQRCCHAQEEVADDISLRQERREQQREQAKWGDGDYWDVDSRLARAIDQGGEWLNGKRELAFLQLFHLGRFLQLSERVFMNSSIPSSNWRFVDDKPPSVWTTAFEDLYSLVLSVTRRLVQTTLFISMSRIRAKSELIPGTKKIVHRKDVEAAISSLGMAPNARRFWLESARRLRLDICDPSLDEGSDDEEAPLSYDDVEAALTDNEVEAEVESDASRVKEEPVSEEEPQDGTEDSTTDEGEPSEHLPTTFGGGDEVDQEVNEVLIHSVADFPETAKAKQALRRRIIAERQQEEHAGACDEYASYKAETEMWEVLHKPTLMPVVKMQDPGPAPLSNLDVESMHGFGRDWTEAIRFCSEWETRPETTDPEE